MEPIVTDLAAVVDHVQNRVAKMETSQNFHANKLDKLHSTANMALTFQTTGSDVDTNMRQVMQGSNPLVQKDQLKRMLTLIENNAQAVAMQRETAKNCLLRLELIEKKISSAPILPSHGPHAKTQTQFGNATSQLHQRNHSVSIHHLTSPTPRRKEGSGAV